MAEKKVHEEVVKYLEDQERGTHSSGEVDHGLILLLALYVVIVVWIAGKIL